MYMKLPLIRPKRDKTMGNQTNETKETLPTIERQMQDEENVNLFSSAELTHIKPETESEKKVKTLNS